MYPLSQTFGYAVLGLCCLARACKGRSQAQDIATCSRVPLPYLRKILRSLAEGGIVDSRRGRDGGVELAREPSEISIWEIAEVVDPALAEKRCLMGLTACSDEHACPLHDFWKVKRNLIEERLRNTSLGDVARFGWSPDVLATPTADRTPAEKPKDGTAADSANAVGPTALTNIRTRRDRR